MVKMNLSYPDQGRWLGSSGRKPISSFPESPRESRRGRQSGIVAPNGTAVKFAVSREILFFFFLYYIFIFTLGSR